MSDIPPPPPADPVPSVPVAKAAPPRRPGALTGAGGILLLAGLLSVVVGTIGLVGEGLDIDAPFLEGESAHRVAAQDPYVRDLVTADAQHVRLGYGSGDEVVEGRWQDALVIPPDQ